MCVPYSSSSPNFTTYKFYLLCIIQANTQQIPMIFPMQIASTSSYVFICYVLLQKNAAFRKVKCGNRECDYHRSNSRKSKQSRDSLLDFNCCVVNNIYCELHQAYYSIDWIKVVARQRFDNFIGACKMFKKLKDKIAEEVKSSPSRIQQLAQVAQVIKAN